MKIIDTLLHGLYQRLKIKVLYTFVVLAAALPGHAFAQIASDAVASPSVMLGKVFFSLMFIIILIFGVAWIAKKFNMGNILPQGDMRVVSSLSLSNKEKLVLVELEGKKLLLGVAPGNVSMLYAFEKPHSDEESPIIDDEAIFENHVKSNSFSMEKNDNKFSSYLAGILKNGSNNEDR